MPAGADGFDAESLLGCLMENVPGPIHRSGARLRVRVPPADA